MMTVTGSCLEWQINRGGSARDLIVEPLKKYADVQLKGWNGAAWPGDVPGARRSCLPVIFSHLPPPPDLLADTKVRLVWLPMWDHTRKYSQGWWNALPKSLRIVAFSNAVANRAKAAGLPTLRLRYFKRPSAFENARWKDGRVLMYWNRTGMVGPRFLDKFCAALRVDRFFFRSQIDPRIPKGAAYTLPGRLGRTTVEELPAFMPNAEYLRTLGEANMFIAPRLYEGVGLAFLEALAQGCAVFGFDAPTMNEYIASGEDGYLLPPFMPSAKNKTLKLLQRGNMFMRRHLGRLGSYGGSRFSHPITTFQDWPAIKALDLERLGKAARLRHQVGFAEWEKSIPDYARFVLEW
jgi:hypothetical protein